MIDNWLPANRPLRREFKGNMIHTTSHGEARS
jgi:hypothetical protein